MRSEARENLWVIVRGQRRIEYFSFRVNDDRAVWSKRIYNAQVYPSAAMASSTIKELQQRNTKRKSQS